MKLKAEPKTTSDAVAILDQMARNRVDLGHLTEQARVNAVVAQLIYRARTMAGLSQTELAARIGSKQSVISRLEDADYRGHSLNALQRIAAALGKSVEIRFVPAVRIGRNQRGHTTYLRTKTNLRPAA